MDMEKLNHLYAVDKTWHALYRILNFIISEILGFLFFGIIIISIIVIVVNFVNKNHNKTIIKEKNPTDNKIKKELNKLKKLYEDELITKKVLEEKQKEILKLYK